MRLNLRLRTTVNVQRKHAVTVPGAAALAVRPNSINGQAQILVVCHLGICPLHLNDADDNIRLEPPLTLRNNFASKFNAANVHDAAYDHQSGLVLFAHGTSIYGLDSTNRVTQLAGDEEGGLIFDGPAAESRFVGAQRLASDGRGMTYIRDRDSSSRNGFCLRALIEVAASDGSGGSGARAVATIHTGGNVGPHVMTYDSCRQSLLFAKRGRAVHQLLPYGITQELLGTDEPPAAVAAGTAAAAAALTSACASASEDSDDDMYDNNDLEVAAPAPVVPPLINVQALAADAASGNVYILDGTTGSRTQLRVLRPDGSLDTLDEQLRIGPAGSSRWPRLAVLPYGHLAVYGASGHEMMVLKL